MTVQLDPLSKKIIKACEDEDPADAFAALVTVTTLLALAGANGNKETVSDIFREIAAQVHQCELDCATLH